MKDEEIRRLLTLPQDWNISDDDFDDTDLDSDSESIHEEASTELPSPIGTALSHDEQSTNLNAIDIDSIPIMIEGTENELYNIETLDPNFVLNDCNNDIVHNSKNNFQPPTLLDNNEIQTEDLPVPSLFTSSGQNNIIQPILTPEGHIRDPIVHNNIHPIHNIQQRERAGPLKWKKRKFITNEPLPSKFIDLSTPLSFFNYFFDDKLLDTIVEQTNLFSNSNAFTRKDIQ